MTTPLIDVVGTLSGELAGLRGDIQSYAARSRHDRRVVRALVVSVVFDIGLSAGLFYGLNKANDAAARAGVASSFTVTNCRAGNASKAIERQLWATVLAYPPPSNETPTARDIRIKQTAQFQTYIDTAFAPGDCSKIGVP